ncbi:nucleotide disphospho-sugar-binding domain-containing protein [Herbidospora sp. NBRC 101105]|uniref:glycosyltransferase n=1 Tax=Herbidospora sp. NBRC 101105 TaxID=3032195 RepID=UPI0024A0E936|nr:nucleotide disphospho-sugar-binding domain-containing protein [Herbidospora sp. NBRC 101105]GLX94483.1 UDP-glucoronosyl and UDP-glucosyl transferase [Herbidospora sp. NBRC 101105]
MARVIMSTHGSHGDVLPFVALGRALRERGHEVELLTHGPFRDLAEGAGLEFTAIDTREAYEANLADTPPLLGAGLGRWRDYYEANGLFEQIVFEIRHTMERYVPGETILVGRHTTAISTLFAAEALDAPAAWVAVTPIQYMSERGIAHTYARTMADRLDAIRAGHGLPPVKDWAAWFASAHLDVALWPSWFDRAGTPAPKRVRLTGAPLGDSAGDHELSPEAEELLDQDAVLVTGGTGRMLHQRFYEVAVEACRAVGRPALLAVRHRDLVPATLPDGMRWFPGLPFERVVPRVGAILHHGGIGTLIRAATSGTPQVVLAHGFDRAENGARVAAAGLGSWLPEQRWSPEEAAALLKAALTGPRVRVPADGGLGAAAEAIEGLAANPVPYSARHLLTREERLALARRLRSGETA